MCESKVSYSKLRGRITEFFRTQGEFSEAMGKSERTISLKMNGKIPFTSDEILLASELLEISSDEIGEYFFKRKVQ